LMMYVRLQEGMSVGEARAAAATLSRHLREREVGPRGVEYPAQVLVLGGVGRLGQDRKAMTVVVFFGILMALVGLVLLIACVNVAGMLLARASARRQEIAIRLSLGASRGRLLQQLIAESALLATLGTAAGLGMAYAVARAVSGMPMPMPVPIRVEVTPDGQVLAYALVLAVVATMASGLAPAWQAVKESLAPELAREKKLRLRRVLVVAQVAVSFVVLVTGALFLRSLAESANMSPGFDVAPVLRAEAHLPPAEYAQPGRMEAYGERVVNELRALPGVEAAAVVRTVPFNDQSTQGGRIRLADTGESIPVRVHTNAVTPEYFRVMGIRLLAGRGLTERGVARQEEAAERTVVVNRVFAEKYLPGRQAVGTTFLWGSRRFQVVGVVEGTKVMTMGEDPQPQLYEPFRQESWAGTRMDFVVRSATPPEGQLRVVQETLRRLEPGAGLLVATMANSMGLALLPAQVGALLMGSVGAVGLLLAAIGLYGVLAYMVVRRTREIGVRMALGATAWQIAGMVMADAGRLVAVGSAIGLGVAVLVTQPLAMFLVPGLSPRDPLSIAAVALVLGVSAVVAAAGPLRRAAGVDPMAALRCE
jgi:predicted permease